LRYERAHSNDVYMVKLVPTSVRLSPKMKERLQKEADAEHRTVTNLIEKLIIEYLDEKDRAAGRRK
jgi:predicted transcriptional regulator